MSKPKTTLLVLEAQRAMVLPEPARADAPFAVKVKVDGPDSIQIGSHVVFSYMRPNYGMRPSIDGKVPDGRHVSKPTTTEVPANIKRVFDGMKQEVGTLLDGQVGWVELDQWMPDLCLGKALTVTGSP